MLLPVHRQNKTKRMSMSSGGKMSSQSGVKWRSWLRLVPCIMAIYLLIYLSIGTEDDDAHGASKMPRDTVIYNQEMFYDMRPNVSDKGHTHPPGLVKRHPFLIFREHGQHAVVRPQYSLPPLPSVNLHITNLTMLRNRTHLRKITTKKPLSYVNPHDFRYILNNPYTCKEESIFLLIFVHSAPDHSEDRDLIRKSWASIIKYGDFNIRTIFLLAKPTDRILQWKIEEENHLFEDIIQEDFIDNYKNLTHKHIMGLKWIKDSCSHAQFIVKVDDDTFINIFKLVDYLDMKYSQKPMENTLYCSVFRNQGPRRDKEDKWYVSVEEYSPDKYPPYCEGFAYIMSPDLVSKLYSASLWTKYYWIDDVYVTGFLTNQIGAKLVNFRGDDGYNIMASQYWHQEHVNTALFLLAKYIKETKTWMKIWSATKKYSLKRTITLRPISEFAKFNV